MWEEGEGKTAPLSSLSALESLGMDAAAALQGGVWVLGTVTTARLSSSEAGPANPEFPLALPLYLPLTSACSLVLGQQNSVLLILLSF